MPFVIVDKSSIAGVRQNLKELKLLRETDKIRKLANGTFAIPILSLPEQTGNSNSSLSLTGITYDVVKNIEILPSQSKKPYDVMVKSVEVYLKERNMWREELVKEIPLSWVKYGDLILFGRSAFADPIWKVIGDSLWQKVCKALKVKRLGRMSGIKPDGFRSPIVEIIYGNGSWVDVVDGHVRKNLSNNGVSSRCSIHFGDNRMVCPQNVADRVYLGLIPTCQPGVVTACKALKSIRGGVLHLHENVTSGRKVLKNSPLKVSQEDTSELPSNVAATPSGIDFEIDLKSELYNEPQCQVCENIEKKFFISLDENSKCKFDCSDRSEKFDYNCSFIMKGNEENIFACPSFEVMWKKKEWFCHAIHMSHVVCSTLSCLHSNPWMVSVVNLHHVKSYAPHIDHLVYDIKCSPMM
ncbi:tRNA wybutosine-synthesizing protein 2 homolog isoform X2 [Ischnura elegans]|uniref:tRNA wybutosine-synthesizing protein 2 homolog isoform X2 n=1 Tax=Ischnura elegans TaxID=197161 RepID=UPI001ED8B496|nr:tRNA wybutosine-synthesizing protein 2 homolog isoform X2 [Ischnura elegans]